MLDIQKSIGFFDPEKITDEVNIIGCGAVGGALAELLSRLGVKKINLWDDDTVCAHNINNQIFLQQDIGKRKTEALSNLLTNINPNIKIRTFTRCSKESIVRGYIFLAVDNIDTRRELCENWRRNPEIKYITDGRMGLTEAVSYSADWYDWTEQGNLLNSMQFSHEEAQKETPVTACGLSQSVVCTPRLLAILMVTNWIKFIKTDGTYYKRFIQVDSYEPFLETYSV